ncbi:MAG: tetratricopeptide repeat protein [Candidatus Contendobacter sp.]|jgi:predicted TPR repeat methyltransferase|nr:tetratricopeptide repeat protein [Gammaproteobacteria bacterium]MCC8992201.1 tetratricopeptide repeat protein [Candidatus Contendobacter sp.]
MNRKQRRALASGAGPSVEQLAQWLQQAIQAQQRGQLSEAEALYRQVLQRDPQQVEALHFLGVLAAQRSQHEAAAELIRRALELNPQYADAWNNLGNVLTALKQPEEAADAYRRTIELAPANVGAHGNLGVILTQIGQIEEAVTACQQATALAPGWAEGHFNLATAWLAQGDYVGAMVAYQEALRLNPDHLRTYKALGLLFYKLNRREDAAELFQRWLERNPDDVAARHMLAASSGCEVPGRAADDYVQTIFDDMADDFDQHLQRLAYQAPALIIQAVAAALGPPNGSLEVLDAGCGTGLCGPLLRPYAHRLTGIDLSPGMVEKARARGGYDELIVAELTAFLAERPATCDLIVSADTLVYFGDLQPLFVAAATALRPGGWLAFTVEEIADAETSVGFSLELSGRYRHSQTYLRRTLAETGLTLATLEPVTPRMESERPVAGLLAMAYQPTLVNG